MSTVHKFSERVIDYAERLSGMADAAEGRRRHQRGKMRWVLLPAAGAGLYAFARSDFFSRQAKEVVSEAKTVASELPDDLVARVREAAQPTSSGNGAARRRSAASKTRSNRASRPRKRNTRTKTSARTS